MADWQLREAKACLSALIKKAASEGPQRITVHGRPAAVLISEAEYQRLRRRKPSFVEFMRSSPLVGAGLGLTREQTKTRGK